MTLLSSTTNLILVNPSYSFIGVFQSPRHPNCTVMRSSPIFLRRTFVAELQDDLMSDYSRAKSLWQCAPWQWLTTSPSHLDLQPLSIQSHLLHSRVNRGLLASPWSAMRHSLWGPNFPTISNPCIATTCKGQTSVRNEVQGLPE